MKRITSLALTIILILGMCFQFTVGVAAAEDTLPLPQIGEVVSGFKTIEVGNMEMINSKTVLFEHEKTGAKLFFIQNKNNDRAFDITFRTPAADNSGANHVLEHLTVSGSQKYPLKNGVFTIGSQTYCSFINAFTSQNFTTYPVSSMSEKQLMKLTDVYLDCAFHPSVYNDKNLFYREAWRYEMSDPSKPLNITGTVYNEMKGALGNISTSARYNVLRTLFPNSVESNVSGGDPTKIKDLTYEQIIKTHDTYYQPSNSLMILYGNVDYRNFLKLINDEYLSKYDRKNVSVDKGKVAPFKSKVEKTFKFPVTASASTKNASQLDYAFALTDISDEDIIGFAALAEVLSQDTSELRKLFNEKQIGGSLAVSFDNSVNQPVLTFSAMNADEKKSKDFKNIVDNYIDSTIKKGFDKELLDAMLSKYLLGVSNMTESSNLGINLALSIGSQWANHNDVNYFSNAIKHIKNIKDKIDDNYFENLISKFIKSNNHAVLVATIPETGLAEKQESQQKKALADLKVSMDKTKIDNIVENTKSYEKWNNRQENPDILKDLQQVKIADLPEEVKKYSLNDNTSADGVRILSAEANVGETSSTSLYFDTSAVPAEKLHYLQLYSSLLGSLDTSSHAKEKLNTLSTRYLNGAGFGLSTLQQKGSKQYTPVMVVSWSGLIGEYGKQLDIVKDILLNTSFENTNDILNLVKSQITNIKNSYQSEPMGLLQNRNIAAWDDNTNYLNYIGGLDYYNFLISLEQTMKSNPKTVTAELNEIKKLIINKTNLITAFAGNKTGITGYRESITTLTGSLTKAAIVKQDYSKLPKPDQKEGIALDTAVQYNMISAGYDKMGTSYTGKYIPIGALINEMYTTPKIRFGNGAYDNIVSFNANGLFVLSYRDPSIRETFEIYKKLPEFINSLNLTQEDLDRFIIQSYGQCAAPTGELNGALGAILDYLTGWTPDDKLKLLREIKSVTVKDVKDISAVLNNFINNGTYTTVGSPDKLNENKDLYNKIITVESQQNQPITREQFFKFVLNGIPNPLDFAKQKGLLSGDGKGNYFESKKVSKEELAVFICRIVKLGGKQLTGKDIKVTDIDASSSWAKDSIKVVVNAEVFKLNNKGEFNPKDEVTASFVQEVLTELTKKLQQ